MLGSGAVEVQLPARPQLPRPNRLSALAAVSLEERDTGDQHPATARATLAHSSLLEAVSKVNEQHLRRTFEGNGNATSSRSRSPPPGPPPPGRPGRPCMPMPPDAPMSARVPRGLDRLDIPRTLPTPLSSRDITLSWQNSEESGIASTVSYQSQSAGSKAPTLPPLRRGSSTRHESPTMRPTSKDSTAVQPGPVSESQRFANLLRPPMASVRQRAMSSVSPIQQASAVQKLSQILMAPTSTRASIGGSLSHSPSPRRSGMQTDWMTIIDAATRSARAPGQVQGDSLQQESQRESARRGSWSPRPRHRQSSSLSPSPGNRACRGWGAMRNLFGIGGAQPQEDASSSRATEKTVLLRKFSPFDRLGADVMRHEGRAWKIRNIEDSGMMARWNMDHPGREIAPGDIITEVNGARGDTNAILDQLRGMTLKIIIERPAPQETASGRPSFNSSYTGSGGQSGFVNSVWGRIGGDGNGDLPQGIAEEDPGGIGLGRLAQAFVKHSGSLERAFTSIDYNKNQKFSMGQWNTGLVNHHIDCKELCGMKANQIFKAIAQHSEDKFYITKDAWVSFWSIELEESDFKEALTADLGEHGGRQTKLATVIKERRATLAVAVAAKKLLNKTRSGFNVDKGEGENGDKDDWQDGCRETGSGERLTLNSGEGLGSEDQQPGGMSGTPRRRSMANRDSLHPSTLGIGSQSTPSRKRMLDGAGSRGSRLDRGLSGTSTALDRAESGSEDSFDDSDEGDDSDDSENDLAGDASKGQTSQAKQRRLELKRAIEEQKRLEKEGGWSGTAFGGGPGAPGRAGSKDKEFIPISALDRLLAGVGTDDDFSKLNDREKQALAEQQLIADELREMDLEGKEAVAYVLRAKLGSYKRKAFRYFDVANQRSFPMMAWDLGMTMLRLNMEVLTGNAANRIFHQMNTNGDNTVSWKEWKTFFKDVRQEALDRMDRENGVLTFEERVSLKKTKLLKEAKETAIKRTKQVKKQFVSPKNEDPRDDGVGSRSTSWSQRVKKKTKDSPSTHSDDAEAARRRALELAARGESDADEEEAPLTEAELFRLNTLADLEGLEEGQMKEFFEITEDDRAAVEAMCEKLGLTIHDKGDDTIEVYNYKNFMLTVRRQLKGLGKDKSLEFSTEFNQVQRHIVGEIATELGLFSSIQGMGKSTRVVVSNNSGFLERIRLELSQIAVGGSRLYTEHLTSCQRNIINGVAEEMELWAHTRKEGRHIEVFNLDDFAKVVLKDLRALSDGEDREYPNLKDMQRQVVFAIAEELELVACDTDTGMGRCITVANLSTFMDDIRERLTPLNQGQKEEFEKFFTPVQNQAVHDVAGEMKLWSETREEEGETWVDVHRLREGQIAPCGRPQIPMKGFGGAGEVQGDDGSVEVSEAARKRGMAVPFPGAHAEDGRGAGVNQANGMGYQSKVGERLSNEAENYADGNKSDRHFDLIRGLFDVFATGMYNGQKIFLRFPNLKSFFMSLQSSMNGSKDKFEKFEKCLESVFGETLQLQIDMDVRTSKGLTFRWFQVFIQAAMRKIGVTALSVLFTISQSESI